MIMKKTLFLLLLFTFALRTLSFAQESESESAERNNDKLHIRLDTRFDLKYMTDAEQEVFQFEAQALKLCLDGEITPGIRYKLVHRLNVSQEIASDGLSKATDQMWLAFDLGKRRNWTLTVGKQPVQLAAFEYEYNPADNYLSTRANATFDCYQIGANIAYNFLGQTLNLQVFNSGRPQFAESRYENKALAGSLSWAGSFLEGALNTRLGYMALQHSSSKLYSWVTTGLQVNAGAFTSEMDYYIGTYNVLYDEISPDLGRREARDQSASVNLRYRVGKWCPIVKGVWDLRRDNQFDANILQSFGVQAAVEFYPFIGRKYLSDMRLHLVYNYVTTDYMGPFQSTPRMHRHTILCGIRWLFTAK